MKKNKSIVLLCSIVYFVSYFTRKNFAIIMSDLLQNNLITKLNGAAICLALFICYGVGQIISGYLGDKIKPKYMITIGLLISAFCNFLMIYTNMPILLIISWAVNGLAQSMLWPPIVKILSTNLDHENYVKANLIVTSSAHISTILLYLYIPFCITYFNWQFVFISSSVLALLTGLLFIICISKLLSKKQNYDINKDEQIKSASILKFFPLASLIMIFIIIIAMGCLRDGIETWLPTLYQEAFNRDSSEAILISILLPIFAIISINLITIFHRKSKIFNNELLGTLICFSISMILSIIILLIFNTNSISLRIICLVLSALICSIMHGCNFLLISCVPGRFKVINRSATISGLCNAFTYVGAAISTYGFSLISEGFGWKSVIFLWVLVSLIGLIISLITSKKYTQFIQNNFIKKTL